LLKINLADGDAIAAVGEKALGAIFDFPAALDHQHCVFAVVRLQSLLDS
jgi:hypothetical protein